MIFKRSVLLVIVIVVSITGSGFAQEGDDGTTPQLTQEFSFFDDTVQIMLPEGWAVNSENEANNVVIFADSQATLDTFSKENPPAGGIYGELSLVETNPVADAPSVLANELGSWNFSAPVATQAFDFTAYNPAAEFNGTVSHNDLNADLNLTVIEAGEGYVTLTLLSFDGEQEALNKAIRDSLTVAPALSVLVPELTQELSFFDTSVSLMLPADWAVQRANEEIGVVTFADSQESLDTFSKENPPLNGIYGELRRIKENKIANAPTVLINELGSWSFGDPIEAQEFAFSPYNSAAEFNGNVSHNDLNADINITVIEAGDGYVMLTLISLNGVQDALNEAIRETIEVPPTLGEAQEFGDGLVTLALPDGWVSQEVLVADLILFASDQTLLNTVFSTAPATAEEGMVGYIELYAVSPTQATQSAQEFLVVQVEDAFGLTENVNATIQTTVVDGVEMATFASEVESETQLWHIHAQATKMEGGYIFVVLISFEGEQTALFNALTNGLAVDFAVLNPAP